MHTYQLLFLEYCEWNILFERFVDSGYVEYAWMRKVQIFHLPNWLVTAKCISTCPKGNLLAHSVSLLVFFFFPKEWQSNIFSDASDNQTWSGDERHFSSCLLIASRTVKSWRMDKVSVVDSIIGLTGEGIMRWGFFFTSQNFYWPWASGWVYFCILQTWDFFRQSVDFYRLRGATGHFWDQFKSIEKIIGYT